VCGGSVYRSVPATTHLFVRFYMRLSTGFQVSPDAFTKLPYNHSNGTGYLSDLFSLGCCGSKEIVYGLQNVPAIGRSTNVPTGSFMPENTWVCLEAEEDVPNGTLRIWRDGALLRTLTGITYPTGAAFVTWQLFRQNGSGYIWYDRFAAGDTRIGCVGGAPPDTTPPAAPTDIFISRARLVP